ncbi:MAG: transglycosylase SLT domain-containing protein [Proteobacteria bacterium]|nr:transglycosylase SLT domain-containing protein [Pseudomonadota bacterium]
MSAFVRHGLAFLALAGLGACASTPPADPARDYGMVAGTRVAPASALPAPEPEPPATTSPSTDDPAALLVSSPVPPESAGPLAGLSNVFDRIRLGYKLPDVADKSVQSQVRYFANKADFLDRTFERAERYLYYVTRELEARGMPLELAFLPVIESAYNPYAYSRARAAGIWQFIAPTARRYEVRVNWWQDGRRDIVDSTRAALDYLQELHNMFDGDWFLAVAAYNCGEAAVQRAVVKARRAGKPTDFWHLKLSRETRGYVPSLLAMARIAADPEKYGLEFAPIANRPYFAQVEIGSQIDLRLAAMFLNVTEDELHELNPSFNRWATDPEGPHHLLVPAESAAEFARTVASLSPELRMPVEHYRVEDGDTVQGLARDRDIPVNTIRQMNGVMTAELRPGEDIVLPASRVAPLRAGLIIEGETPLPGHRRHIYVVRRGETLASIAHRHHVGVEELARLNDLPPYAHLKAGNRLIVEVSERKVKHRKKKTARPAQAAQATAGRGGGHDSSG